MQFITELLNQYGYIVLFAALVLELIAFPTPGEALMTYCGFLVFQGKLNWGFSIIVAAFGVISGITLSYFTGHALGSPFFEKYGSYIHMGPDRLEKTSNWFKKYGNGLLVIAYFIPGVRHITGYFSGITKIPFKRFALNAYIGAFIWTGTFISLGKVLGSSWEKFHGIIRRYLIIGGIIAAVVLLCFYIYKNRKLQINAFVVKSLENSLLIFHSLGRIKIAIAGVALVFIALSALLIGLVQDFLANEFSQFDTVVRFLVSLIFTENWSSTMRQFESLTSYPALLVVTVLLITWIMVKGKNRSLEVRSLFVVILGGEALEEVLRLIFHRTGPLGSSAGDNVYYTFPSEQSLMAIVVYGFAAYMIVRHARRGWIGTAAVPTTLIACILIGVSPVFFQTQFPSDIMAGYVFGGVWLSLNIIILEVFRVLPKVKLHT